MFRGIGRRLAVLNAMTVLVVIAQGTVTPAGVVPRMRRFTVAGFVDAGMYEFDQGLGLVHLDDARRLFRLGDAVTGLRYAFDDPATAAGRIRAMACHGLWQANHPSPLSAHRPPVPFVGCGHFGAAAAFLASHGRPIDWSPSTSRLGAGERLRSPQNEI